MGSLYRCLPLVYVSSSPLQLHLHSPSHKTHFPIPYPCPNSPSVVLKSAPFSRKTAKYGSKSSERTDPSYADENAVVGDMDGLLSSLSLEYDSVWDTKPYWCQPWTIVLTGTLVVVCSWIVLHSVIVTALASSLIGAWWYIFLYSYPKSYSEMIADRRKRVANGMEDIYGVNKNEL